MFAEQYAEFYDFFHANKDYQKEVNQIINVLNLSEIRGLTGFDFGCGTGVHAAEFLKRGAFVDGYDISTDMLAQARKKNPSIFFSNNLDDFKLDYDFTYSLFDVISYQVSADAAMGLVSSLFSRTRPGGYCLIDSWNSEGVRVDPPRINERVVSSNFGQITRRVTPDLSESKKDIYVLRIELLSGETKEILRAEQHVMRAWSPEQILEMMRSAGFKELSLYDPGNPRKEFAKNDWRFGIKAKRF